MILLKISVHSDEHNCVFLNIRACYVADQTAEEVSADDTNNSPRVSGLQRLKVLHIYKLSLCHTHIQGQES